MIRYFHTLPELWGLLTLGLKLTVTCIYLRPPPLLWNVLPRDLSPPPLQEALTKTIGCYFHINPKSCFFHIEHIVLHSEKMPWLGAWGLHTRPASLHPNHLSHPLKSKLLKDCLSHCHLPNSMPEEWRGLPTSVCWMPDGQKEHIRWDWPLWGKMTRVNRSSLMHTYLSLHYRDGRKLECIIKEKQTQKNPRNFTRQAFFL